MAVKHKPEGYHTATPYLVVDDAEGAIAFYKKAFGATELVRMPRPDGKIGHAEIKIGDSPIMLSDPCPITGGRSPKTLGGTPMSLMIYVEDVDSLVPLAIDAGAKVLRPVKDQFYGDRSGTFEDPFGHVWTIGTHVEDVPHDEMQRRVEAFMKQSA